MICSFFYEVLQINEGKNEEHHFPTKVRRFHKPLLNDLNHRNKNIGAKTTSLGFVGGTPDDSAMSFSCHIPVWCVMMPICGCEPSASSIF